MSLFWTNAKFSKAHSFSLFSQFFLMNFSFPYTTTKNEATLDRFTLWPFVSPSHGECFLLSITIWIAWRRSKIKYDFSIPFFCKYSQLDRTTTKAAYHVVFHSLYPSFHRILYYYPTLVQSQRKQKFNSISQWRLKQLIQSMFL